MECSICRSQLTDADKFCPACGTKVEHAPTKSTASVTPNSQNMTMGKQNKALDQQQYQPEPTSQQGWNPKKEKYPPLQNPSNENNQNQGNWWNQPQTQDRNNQNTQGNLNNKNSQWFSGNQNAQGSWNNQNAQGSWNQNQWGNSENTDYYQQPIQQQWNTGQLPRIPILSEPANLYPVPNSQLNIVIIINWIQFWILMVLNLLVLVIFFPALIITAPLTYLQYWTAKMLRRYSETAKTIALILAGLSAISVFSGNLFGLIGAYEIYVLGFHEETKMQFNKALL